MAEALTQWAPLFLALWFKMTYFGVLCFVLFFTFISLS